MEDNKAYYFRCNLQSRGLSLLENLLDTHLRKVPSRYPRNWEIENHYRMEPALERKQEGNGGTRARKGVELRGETKVRCKNVKKERDRNCREIEASGLTLPSARVFRKFDKSRPTSRSPSHPLLLLFYLPASPHTSIARASDEISSSSQSLVIPEAFWAGTRYTPQLSRKLLSPLPPYWSGLDPHSALFVP